MKNIKQDFETECKQLKRIILSAPGADEPDFIASYRKWWNTYFRPLREGKN